MSTVLLAVILGWFLVMLGTLILFQRENFAAAMTEAVEHRGIFVILAVFTFIIGLILVSIHNIWVMDLQVVITIIAWLILLNGLFRLFCQATAMKWMRSFLNHRGWMITAAIVFFLLGLFLLSGAYFLLSPSFCTSVGLNW